MLTLGVDRPTQSINTPGVSVLHILVVTGASGAGKTATVRALDARGIPGVRCFYFDSIGVPTAEVMERDYGR
jgi:type II secretory pathway predicted ATPase ExeA